jgi:hypothetical protein
MKLQKTTIFISPCPLLINIPMYLLADPRLWQNSVKTHYYKVVQIWPGLFLCKQVTVCPRHIWTTLYMGFSTNQWWLYLLSVQLEKWEGRMHSVKHNHLLQCQLYLHEVYTILTYCVLVTESNFNITLASSLQKCCYKHLGEVSLNLTCLITDIQKEQLQLTLNHTKVA